MKFLISQLLILLFCSTTALANNSCPSDPTTYNGEEIVTLKDIQYNIECIKATSNIEIDCKTSYKTETSAKHCNKGKVLACRFCKPQGEPICDYSHLPLKGIQNFSLTAQDCTSLEKTPAKFKKVVLNYDQVCLKRSTLLEKVGLAQKNISDLMQYSNQDFKSNDRAGEIYNHILNTSKTISGSNGLLEILDGFGNSDTISRFRKSTSEANKQWEKIVSMALTAKYYTDEEFVDFRLKANAVINSYLALEQSFSTLAYKPEGAKTAKECK